MSTLWRTTAAAALLALALPVAGSPANAADRDGPAREDRKPARKAAPSPGDTVRAKVVKTGWWWVANEPPPETGLLAAPQPPTPTTPAGLIPVGAAAGDPERISAVEVKLKAEPGSTVRSFELVLRESGEPGANVNAEEASVVACPVTELFWADGRGAAWKDRPGYDCGLAEAAGKRTKKGLWRFDLTTLATTWLAEGNTDSRSFVLVESVPAPEGFQLAFDGVKDKGVGLALKATPPPPAPDVPPPPGAAAGSGGAGDVAATGGGLGAGAGGAALSGGGGGAPAGDLGGATGDQAATDAGSASEAPTDGRLRATPVAAVPPWYSGLPRAAWVLVPLALGLAYLIMLALGPDARPAPAAGQRGVGRALERLRTTAGDLRGAR